MPNPAFWFSIVLSASALLTGCLSGADSTSDARTRPNSFPPINDDFTDTGTGDTGNARTLKANEVRVTVQVPAAMAGSGATETRRNLYVVEPASLRVVRVGAGLQEQESLAVSRRQDEQGSVILRLDDLANVPTDPDYIIEGTLADGTPVRGPLSDLDQDVKLNPFSEYLVSVTLAGLGAEQLEEIKACDASNNICLNQLMWPTLVDQIQDFEINIPSGLRWDSAVDFLGERADLTDYVDNMVGALSVSDSRSTGISVDSAGFNTVYFGLELNRKILESGSTAGQWGIRRMTTGTVEGNGGDAEIYPNLTLTSFDALGLAVNSIAGESPYTRYTLTQAETDQFDATDWDANRHATAPGAAIIKDQRFLLAGRTALQSVSEEHGRLWGWAPNPHFFNSLIIRDSEDRPEALLASYFHSGKALELARAGSGRFDRLETLEDLAIGTLEVNLKQLDSDDQAEPYDLSVLSGDFNAVSFAVRLDEESGNPLEARASASDWGSTGAGNSSATFTEQAASGWLIARTDTGTAIGPNPGADLETIVLENEPDEIYLNADNPEATAYYGRLQVTDGGSPGIGAAIESGNLLAYTFVDSQRGQGVRVAAREVGSIPTSGVYQLQGFMLGLTDDANRLEQVNGSILTVNSETDVTLQLARIQTTHRLVDDSVSDPQRVSTQGLSGAVSASAGGNLTLTFDNSQLQLQGFATQGGDLLVFAACSGDSLGLVLGFREE